MEQIEKLSTYIKNKEQRAERGVSVDDAIDAIKQSDYESIVVVGIDKEGKIEFSYSGRTNLELLGLLDLAKDIIRANM